MRSKRPPIYGGLFHFMENYYVYILYSKVFDKYYIGQTNNVEARLFRHNNSKFKSFTSKYRPWKVVAEIFIGNDRGNAIVIERYIKKQKSREFIEKIIENQNNDDFIAQLVRVPFKRD